MPCNNPPPQRRIGGWVVRERFGMSFKTQFSSERPQEIDDVLLILGGQPTEALDNSTCLASFALMRPDGLHQVGRASVVEEKDALPDAPERGGSEFIGSGTALRNAVSEAFSHVVNEEVGPEVRRLVGKRGTRTGRGAAGNGLARGQRRRMAMGAADFYKGGSSVRYRRRVGCGYRRSQHAHKVGKRLDVGDDGRIGGGSRGRRRKVECIVR
jgi:hypothetical protein